MKRNSAKPELERNGAKHARLDEANNTKDGRCNQRQVRIGSRNGEPVPRQNTESSEQGPDKSGERTKLFPKNSIIPPSNGIRGRITRIPASPSPENVGNGIIQFHQPILNLGPGPCLSSDTASKQKDFTTLKPRSKPACSEKPNNVLPSTAFQKSGTVSPASYLLKDASSSSKLLSKASLPKGFQAKPSSVPQAPSSKTSSDSKTSKRSKPVSIPFSSDIAHQIITPSVSTVNVSSTPSVNVLNRAQTLFSVSSLKDTTSDFIQGSMQLPLYDSLYMGSPIASPLFTDSATSFPFTSSTDLIDPDSVYLDQLFSRSQNAQENNGFTSIRSENHCARTDCVPPFPFSSPRLLNSVVDSVSMIPQQCNSTGSSLLSQTSSRSYIDPKKKNSIHSAIDRLSAAVKSTAKSSSSPAATCSRLSDDKSSKSSAFKSSSLFSGVDKSVSGDSSGAALQSNRLLSLGSKSSSNSDELKPPPPGGIRRAGPYLLGKFYLVKADYVIIELWT